METNYYPTKSIVETMNDAFFGKIFEDKDVCEEILRVILEDDKLEVLSVTPQCNINNLYEDYVRLDAFCKLGTDELCNIVVLKTNNSDYIRRERINASHFIMNNTRIEKNNIDAPKITMVCISTIDMFNKGRTIYHCKKVIEGIDKEIDYGLKEIYVNTAINDGSIISELMECFTQEQVNNEKFPLLSKRVGYLKMCGRIDS